MKLKSIVGSAVALTLGLGGAAFAADNYTPPERIHCHLNDTQQLSCNDFNRQYLLEDGFNLDIPKNQDVILTFRSAAAYFTTSKDAVSVFFTYGPRSQYVKLRTVVSNMGPDVEHNKNWVQENNSKYIYKCTNGYMSCSITKLTGSSR